MKTTFRIILILVVLAFLGTGIALQSNTLIDWWKPAALCFLPAAVAGFLMEGKLQWATTAHSRLINVAAGIFISFSILYGCFIAMNYVKSDADTSESFKASVVGKYSEERYRVKRVARHRTTRGEKYHVYCILVSLPDGKTKKVEVSPGEYIKIKKGQKLELKIEDGLFGIPVIKNLRLPVRERKSSTCENPSKIPLCAKTI